MFLFWFFRQTTVTGNHLSIWCYFHIHCIDIIHFIEHSLPTSSFRCVSNPFHSTNTSPHHTTQYYSSLFISSALYCLVLWFFFHLWFWIYFMLLKIHAKMCVCYRSVRGRCDYKCWGMCVGVREITSERNRASSLNITICRCQCSLWHTNHILLSLSLSFTLCFILCVWAVGIASTKPVIASIHHLYTVWTYERRHL